MPSPMTDGTAVERQFSAIAADYDLLTWIYPLAADVSRRVGELIGRWQPSAAKTTVDLIELGCGTGVTTLSLLKSRADGVVTAVDNEPGMISQARRNLASALNDGTLKVVESDALSFLRTLATASVDIVASAYTLHNLQQAYRVKVLEEIARVLRAGGIFVNGDRYAQDDSNEQLRLIQDEARGYFRECAKLGRMDLLEQWILHLFSDESAAHLMPLEKALGEMRASGFQSVSVEFREGVNALVTGSKP
jgi:ubiquinone/menaquinone biosynthesis C-methylase UbiE